MQQAADAIIIGTGVIGTAVAYELSKAGWTTLSLDRNSQIGHGSTAGSCAIIRMHYSTFDGTAFAWEGWHYWRDWAGYLEAPGEFHREAQHRGRMMYPSVLKRRTVLPCQDIPTSRRRREIG